MRADGAAARAVRESAGKIEGEQVRGGRGRTGGRRLRHLGGEADMAENTLHDDRILYRRDEAQPPPALRTGQHVDRKDAPQEIRPREVASRGRGGARMLGGTSAGVVCYSVHRVARDGRCHRAGAPTGVRREEPMVQHQVDPGPWDQNGQLLEELERFEEESARAIAPSVRECAVVSPRFSYSSRR